MNRLFLLSVALVGLSARAELPVVAATSRVEGQGGAFLVLSGRSVGAGLLRAGRVPGEAFALQADVALRDAYVQVMAARQVPLLPLDGRALHAAAQLGLDAVATTRGPLQLGVGPNAGLSLGAGPAWLSGFGTLQAGVEVLPAGGPPLFRFPLRAGLGAQSRLGLLDARLVLMLGVDVYERQPATVRADAVLAVGFRP